MVMFYAKWDSCRADRSVTRGGMRKHSGLQKGVYDEGNPGNYKEDDRE